MQPKLTVSGYRGIWGETLTEDIARAYARAFGALIHSRHGTRILIGRDSRTSGKTIAIAVADEIARLGIDIVDLGVVSTPTGIFAVRESGADGAIIVTASHNPIQYNGLKFVTSAAEFTNEADVAEMLGLKDTPILPATKRGSVTEMRDAFDKHLTKLLTHIDTATIAQKKFRVALDPINSVGCESTPKLFRALGVESSIINGEPTGLFAHEPEPLPKNLGGLRDAVLASECAVGFAQDPDADRLVLCDETGTLLSEELTLALCLRALLRKTPGMIVINLSTSNRSEDAALAYGCTTIRSKVGEANVSNTMREHGAVAGGEGGGGIIWPAVNFARDSYVGIALVLELMAQENKPLSAIVAALPVWEMVKEKIPFSGDLATAFDGLAALFPGATVNRTDGLRLDFPDRSWVHIRASNTEPVIRVIAEAATSDAVADLTRKAKNFLESCPTPND